MVFEARDARKARRDSWRHWEAREGEVVLWKRGKEEEGDEARVKGRGGGGGGE